MAASLFYVLVFFLMLGAFQTTESAPLANTNQEQFFDDYEGTEAYLESCSPPLKVIFEKTLLDPAGQLRSSFGRACPPKSPQHQVSMLCNMFAYRINSMCDLSKAMSNANEEFYTTMTKLFIQYSPTQIAMNEGTFCADMTDPSMTGKRQLDRGPEDKAISLSPWEIYYMRQAGIPVAGPLPLDSPTCSRLWRAMQCDTPDMPELNVICQAYAFLATREGPILEGHKGLLSMYGQSLENKEPQDPQEQGNSDSHQSETPDKGPNNEIPNPNQENPLGNPNGMPSTNQRIPVGNPMPVNDKATPQGGPNNEVPFNQNTPLEGSNNEVPINNQNNPLEVPNNEVPINQNTPLEGSNNEVPINQNTPLKAPNNEVPINNQNNPLVGPNNEGPNNEVPNNDQDIPGGGPNNEVPGSNQDTPNGGPNDEIPQVENPGLNEGNRQGEDDSESDYDEEEKPGLRPPGDYGDDDEDDDDDEYSDSDLDNDSDGADDQWGSNQFENQEENHKPEEFLGDQGNQEMNPGIQDQEPAQNIKYEHTYDDDDGNTHFLAYSLTAIILILATYIMYHNKQKIIAVVIEGRNSRGRRKRGGSGYQKLDQNISEAMPSMHSQNA
nr:trans-Golgi network integral membrane protein 2-like [Lytechinus pictus]